MATSWTEYCMEFLSDFWLDVKNWKLFFEYSTTICHEQLLFPPVIYMYNKIRKGNITQRNVT